MGDKPDLGRYKRGDKLPSGYVIRDIVGRDEHLLMVTTIEPNDQTGVYWLSSDDVTFSGRQLGHVQAFNIRYNNVRDALPHDGGAMELLAETLYGALRVPEQTKEEAFGEFDAWLKARVEKVKALSRGRTIYAIAASVAVLPILILAGSFLQPADLAGEGKVLSVANLAMAVAAGALGAWCSVIQKLPQLQLSPFDGTLEASTAATSRVALGAVFGGVGYVLAVTGLVLNALLHVTAGVALIGFMAGIVERFVPDFIAEYVSRSKSKKDQGTKE